MNKRSGFLLLETMIGVAVFALGALVLAKCLNHCIDAEIVKMQDQRARLVLENRMAEIEGGAIRFENNEVREEKLEGRFTGITLRQSREPLELVNENDEKLSGLYAVTLQAVWAAPQGDQTKELRFYVYSAN